MAPWCWPGPGFSRLLLPVTGTVLLQYTQASGSPESEARALTHWHESPAEYSESARARGGYISEEMGLTPTPEDVTRKCLARPSGLAGSHGDLVGPWKSRSSIVAWGLRPKDSGAILPLGVSAVACGRARGRTPP